MLPVRAPTSNSYVMKPLDGHHNTYLHCFVVVVIIFGFTIIITIIIFIIIIIIKKKGKIDIEKRRTHRKLQGISASFTAILEAGNTPQPHNLRRTRSVLTLPACVSSRLMKRVIDV